MKPWTVLAPALLAVCMGCGGNSAPPPTVTVSGPSPENEGFEFGQPYTLRWTMGGGAPTTLELDEMSRFAASVDVTETSLTVTPVTPCAYEVVAMNGAGSSTAQWNFFPHKTTTTLGSNDNPAPLGAPVTFTANVTNGATGQIQFWDDSSGKDVNIGETPIIAGVASLTLANLVPGNHTILSFYGGDDFHCGSCSPRLIQVINP